MVTAEVSVEKDDASMGNADVIKLEDGKLWVKGVTLLSDIPKNVTVTQDRGPESKKGVFLGGTAENPNSRHLFSLGQLRGHRFLSCFRFKLWWMTQKVGNRGGEIPVETQFLLVESREEKESTENSVDACGGHTDITYIVFLPLLDGSFRTSLQGNEKDELLMCAESGDPGVTSTECAHSVYVHSGTDPYRVTSEAVRAIEDHSKSFLRREKKQLPGMLDYFGWCTWDAFYTDVSVEGVHQGLTSLAEGGTPAKFLIIDDGWQSVDLDRGTEKPGEIVNQFAQRLTDIKENVKFQQVGNNVEDFGVDLGHVVGTMKKAHNLKYIYVWHALMGYWGGVRPGEGSMDKYESSLIYPSLPVGILEQMPDMASDTLTINGLGVVHPDKVMEFYDELHTYLAKQGVDGVKVDVQAILETLGAGYGGRVKLAKVFHEALETSIAKNFPDNGIISCMSHHTDGLYSAKQTAVMRASDDFWPRDPASHTTHIASVSYNSLFLGEFMQPDWDMFHSRHPAAAYHGAARAIGGCAVYVSDKPREHDFDLLRKLVLPDGTVLRALLPGRPTRGSLFVDPARDRQSILKIWNLNSCTGVVGAFNCQGAGWCRVDRKYSIHDTNPGAVTGSMCAMDVDALKTLTFEDWEGETAIYSHKEEELRRVSETESISLSLKSLDFEIYTVSPIKKMTPSLEFAPIGLVHMFNSGGAILSVDYSPKGAKMKVRGCGDFGAYSSEKPSHCWVDSREVDFTYDSVKWKLVICLEHRAGHVWNVAVEF